MIIILAAAAFMMFLNSSQQGSMHFTYILLLKYFISYTIFFFKHMQESSDIQACFMASGLDFLSWLRNGAAVMNIGFMGMGNLVFLRMFLILIAYFSLM